MTVDLVGIHDNSSWNPWQPQHYGLTPGTLFQQQNMHGYCKLQAWLYVAHNVIMPKTLETSKKIAVG